jgi:hypothetical protein
MEERELASMVGLVMCHLEAVLKGLPEKTQVVIRPTLTWPDGRPTVWVIINTPN